MFTESCWEVRLSWFVLLVFSTRMVHSSSALEFRLPPDVVPKHYDLDIITNLGPVDFNFQGNVLIKVECVKATNVIKVHARDLSFTTEKVFVKPEGEDSANSVSVSSTQHDADNEFFIIKTKELLSTGNIYLLNLPFQGQLKEDLIGYYRSSYFDRGSNSTKWLAVTHFEPSDARQAFPCFDEPGMKATFNIRLAHRDNFKAVSNMPLKSTTPFEGKTGWVWSEFETTVPISTYIIAYMVSEFSYRQAEPQPNNVKFRVWARPEAIDQSEFAKQVGPRFLGFYEQFFSVKYPLPKQDLLAIPDFKIGAMENWGIITFREASLLLNEKTTSSSNKLSIADVIAHELAHMWFGNLVTMKWWTDLWLKEGFATYMACVCVHHEFPDWNYLDSAALRTLLNVFHLDSLVSSHPVSVPIQHPREISQIFDAISYDKGSFLLRMMSLFLGEEVFRRGVSEYLKKHQFGNAEQDDLWSSLTEQALKAHVLPAELTVKQIMDTWTLQTGYPLITVSRNYDTLTATVTQKRYLAVKSGKAEDYKGAWWVPLSFSTSTSPEFSQTQPRHWLGKHEKQKEITIGVGKGEWFILNNRAAGLYRVNYDQYNWALLTATLNSPKHSDVNVLNRAQLLTDAMDLAQLGEVDYQLALKLVGYLRLETEFIPWNAGLSALQPIKVILSRTADYGIFKKYLRSLLAPMVSRLGRLTDGSKDLEGGRLLSLITQWALPLSVGDISQQAWQLYQQWAASADPDLDNPIPKDVRQAVYSHAVREGGESAWEFLWQRYKNANVSTECHSILLALTNTKEIWLLNRYLEWSLDESSDIRKQDAFIVFSAIASKDVGFYIAQKFFFRNVKRISEYYGEQSKIIGSYFSSLAEQMIYPNELEELKWFAENNKKYLAAASLSVLQALEAVQLNINWMENHYQTISSVLNDLSFE